MDGQISSSSEEKVDMDQLQQELSKAVNQAEENLVGWKRAQADLENFRKRTEAASEEWITFGKQAAFVKLAPILDSLKQAMLYAPEIQDEKYIKWKEGLLAIIKQIDQAMSEVGIKRIEAVGKKFDPHFHEAVKEVPGKEDGTVVEEYQSGYTLDGKVLRPAQVVISKKIEE